MRQTFVLVILISDGQTTNYFLCMKAVHRNIRAGFDDNLRDYMDKDVIRHAFHHNAFLVVGNSNRVRYPSITSVNHFAEWKRQNEHDSGSVDADVLNGMPAKERLLDIVDSLTFDLSQIDMAKRDLRVVDLRRV